MSESSAGWDCDAYGPDQAAIGALCFIAGEPGQRGCASLEECRKVMAAERARVFTAINERAVDGDPVSAYLASQFGTPGDILGGGAAEQVPPA